MTKQTDRPPQPLQAPPHSPRPARREWAAGWPLVVAGFVGLAATSAPAAVLGVMLHPLTTAYGWSRTEYAGGFSIVAMVMLCVSAFVGAAIDRFGARRILIPALVVLHLGFAGLAFAGPSLLAWYLAMAVIGVGLAAAGPLGWAPAVASRFENGRALALGMVLTGSGFAAAVVPLLASALLAQSNHRITFLTLAGLGLAASLPLALLFCRDASDLRRAQNHPQGPKGVVAPANLTGYSPREAFASSRYWRLCLSMVAIVAGTGVLNLHLIAHVVENGAQPIRAAVALAILGPASIFGRLATGYLLDRFSVPLVAGVAFALAALGNVMIAGNSGDLGLAMLAVFLVGAAAGAESDIAAFALSRYFGLRAFGTLFGTMFGLIALTYGVAPTLAALARDHLGTYEMVFLAVAGAASAAALLAATLGRYPDFGAAALQKGEFAST